MPENKDQITENSTPETNAPEADATETKAKDKQSKKTAEKLVKIRLPIIPGKEKQEAQFVRVNNRTWVIPRGVEMEVPECVVEVLRHSEDMQLEALKYQQSINKD